MDVFHLAPRSNTPGNDAIFRPAAIFPATATRDGGVARSRGRDGVATKPREFPLLLLFSTAMLLIPFLSVVRGVFLISHEQWDTAFMNISQYGARPRKSLPSGNNRSVMFEFDRLP